jgi:two-component sensor histidine kinase
MDQKRAIGIGLQTDRENRLRLTVWDNGRGIPPEIDSFQSESLGLKLVMSLVRQLGGEVEIDRNEGTKFEIVFERKT